MLTDITGRPIHSGMDGWYDFHLIPADRAHEVAGLEEIAALAAAGGLAADQPVFHATRRSDAPYPDVRVGVPLEVADLQAWQAGDRTIARDVVEALEESYLDFMRRVRADRVE